jgi:acetyl-CoA/propionyl-CoA carboxylase biotin carboxyl carrier protein
VKIAVTEGEVVEIGQTIVVLEAMKMEQPIKAHKAGTIKNIKAEVGTTVPAGTVLMEIED